MRCKKLSDIQKAIEADEYKWDLSAEHELTYKERRRSIAYSSGPTAPNPNDLVRLRQESDIPVPAEATFTAQIVAAEPDALVISVTTKEDEKHSVTGLVKLSGKWELDDKNRITFSVKKPFDLAQGKGLDKANTLTFQGAWEVNENHEVVYSFTTKTVVEGSGKKRRRVTKTTQELVFKGEWDLSEQNKLTYLIGVDTDSAFRFRGTFESSSILAKKGEIRYQVGIEYQLKTGARKRLTQTITLFGKWKLSDDLALSFELEYADGRRAEISVGVDLDLKKLQGPGFRRLLPDEVSIDLVSKEGGPLGVEVVLTKDLFDGNVQTFVRFRESLKETAVEAGIKIPW